MKKVQILFVFCIANILILASPTKQYSEEKKTNLYDYVTVVTSEDNLKNLFRNFPIFIENGKEIDFLSYQFNENMLSEEMSCVRLDLQQIHESKSELKKMVKTISEEYVHVGDEVYQINYVFNLQKHVHYIFINPKSKKVLLKGNIFGIEIPISHFEYIEKKHKMM